MLNLKEIQRLFEKEEYNRAKEELKLYLEYNSKDIAAWGLLARTYHCLEDFQQSLGTYKKILVIDPHNSEAKEQLELTEEHLSEEKKAREKLKQTNEGYIFRSEKYWKGTNLSLPIVSGLLLLLMAYLWLSDTYSSNSSKISLTLPCVLFFLWSLYHYFFCFVIEIAVGQSKIKLSTALIKKEYVWADIKEVILEDKIGTSGHRYKFLVIRAVDKKYVSRLFCPDIGSYLDNHKVLIDRIGEHIYIKTIKTQGIVFF